MSVLPLIWDSASVLMLSLNEDQALHADAALHEVLHVPGVISYTVPRFWPNDSNSIIGSLHVQVSADADAQAVREQVARELTAHLSGLIECCVQVEKPGFPCFCGGGGAKIGGRTTGLGGGMNGAGVENYSDLGHGHGHPNGLGGIGVMGLGTEERSKQL